MGYPKYIFVLTLIMFFLAGYVFLSLGWIGMTGFMGLLVFSLPVYWLETRWRNQSISHQIAKDQIRILPFQSWSFERLVYYQFILLFVVSVPGMFFQESTMSMVQVVLALVFGIGLLISKYYRERKELQSYQLTKQQFKVFEYGFTKKVNWNQIKSIEKIGNQLFIHQKNENRIRIKPEALSEEDRTYLLRTLKNFAQKKDLPYQLKMQSLPPRPWYLEDWKQGLLFLGVTLLNIIVLFGY